MSMKIGHIVGTMPPALLGAVYLPAPAGVEGSVSEPVFRIGFFVLALATSTVNDWDHSRFRDRWHPGAMFTRVTARALYRIHTSRDLDRWEYLARRFPDREPPPIDLHRGPTHAVEWCLLVSGALAWGAAEFPPTSLVWSWALLAALLGTAGHVGIDALTPSGVPGSMVYNYLVHGEVWRRHAVSLRWHAVGWRGVDDGAPITFRSPGIVTKTVRMWPLPVYRDFAWLAMVQRTLSFPTPTIIPVDESHEGCRPGIFYTDSCAERLGFVPVMAFATLLLGLVITGTFAPLMWALTGWSVFA